MFNYQLNVKNSAAKEFKKLPLPIRHWCSLIKGEKSYGVRLRGNREIIKTQPYPDFYYSIIVIISKKKETKNNVNIEEKLYRNPE